MFEEARDMCRRFLSFMVGLAVPLACVAAMFMAAVHHPPPSRRMCAAFDETLVRDELYSMMAANAADADAESCDVLFVMPAHGIITSPYGWRRDPIAGDRRFHAGVDIANMRMSGVRAAAAGTVLAAASAKGYGNVVVIGHAHGFETRYAHLTKIVVREGTRVDAGDVIGGMGTTGRSTGNHLHFEVRRDGIPLDPFAHMVIQRVMLAGGRRP